MTARPSKGTEIDRIAPTLRPSGRTVMRQNWSDLLFLHWAVPAEALLPLLPPGLELDTFEGCAYVGLVPFTMTGVRPTLLPPFPPLSNFHETNVRTYVHFQGRDPGVWFFSLDAANSVAVRLARAWFKLPYYFARMRLVKENTVSSSGSAQADSSDWTVDYATERLWPEPTPARCAVRYTPTGAITNAKAGTLDHFLIERYILYAYKDGRLYQGRVHHATYPVQTANVHSLDENLVAATGIIRPDTPPLVHFSPGVRVEIFPLQRMEN